MVAGKGFIFRLSGLERSKAKASLSLRNTLPVPLLVIALLLSMAIWAAASPATAAPRVRSSGNGWEPVAWSRV